MAAVATILAGFAKGLGGRHRSFRATQQVRAELTTCMAAGPASTNVTAVPSAAEVTRERLPSGVRHDQQLGCLGEALCQTKPACLNARRDILRQPLKICNAL